MLILILFWLVPFVLSMFLGYLHFKNYSLYVKNVTQFTFAALFPLVNIGLMLFAMFDIIDNLDIMNKKIKL